MRYTFGAYTLDMQRYELCQAGTPLQLHPKVFDLLAYLLQHRARVVPRQELFDTLWPAHFVSDDALEWLMAAARRAVGDSGRAQRVIQTVRTRGYRWVAPVAVYPPPLPDVAGLTTAARAPGAADHAAAPHPVAGERKQVTVLAGALVPVVAQAVGMDAETLYTVQQRVFTVAQQAVGHYAGIIQSVVDQAFLAVFGAPVAQEDHARRAVLAAFHIQENLRSLDPPLAPGTGQEWAVCQGVHTGEVIVGAIGDDRHQIIVTVGDTTQVAQALLRLAEPGAILLSAATSRLVRDFVRLDRVGPVNVQGMTVAQTVYKVLGLSSHPTAVEWQGRRVVRQFVGREREMGTLHALLTQVEAGHGQVVGIAGEPGIGKSRFLYEFRQQVHHTPFTYLTGRCVSYGRATPYLPLLDLVRQACGLTERDTSDAIAAKVSQSLQAIGMASETWGPYVLCLLGREDSTAHLPPLSPQALRSRISEALLQMQLHASRQRPLLLEVEDVHWIDPTSEEWLVALVEHLAGMPILLLLSYRSGYQPAWIGKSYATQLALQRLTADESQRVVRAVLPQPSVPEALVRAIVAKGQGNPFFLEELAQAVVEQGGPHPTLVMPETVQAVLAARLDRLPPEAKTLLQVAAVIGTEVPSALLQAVTAVADTTLCQCLARLQEAELLYTALSVPEPVYAFKHALTHEVAYQSLLRNTRQQYHRQIAEVLVARFVAVVATQPEVLAHHYTEAGFNEQAIPYWQQAGERAAARSAHREAVAHLTKSLEVLQMLPETTDRARRELGLQLALGPSLIVTMGPGAPEVGQARARARVLCEHVGDSVQMAAVLDGLWYFHLVRGNLQMALGLAEELLRLAQRASDVFLHVQAHFEMGLTLFFRGTLVASRSHYEQALACSDPQQHSDQAGQNGGNDRVVACLSHLAWNLSVLGYPAQAMTRLREALTRAHALGYPYSQVYALIHAVTIHQHRREAQAVQEYAEAMMAICEEQGFAHWLAAGRFYRGWALVAQGLTAEGMAQMRQGLARVSHTRGPMGPYTLALWAEACAHQGQTAEGWAVLEQARAEVDRSEGCFYAAELYRLQGEFLLRQTALDTRQAERCFRHALDLARRAQATWWELRAAMSLCRLWQHQGKHQEAHALLALLYGWFTEGFDTADLQEAQALLHQLCTTP